MADNSSKMSGDDDDPTGPAAFFQNTPLLDADSQLLPMEVNLNTTSGQRPHAAANSTVSSTQANIANDPFYQKLEPVSIVPGNQDLMYGQSSLGQQSVNMSANQGMTVEIPSSPANDSKTMLSPKRSPKPSLKVLENEAALLAPVGVVPKSKPKTPKSKPSSALQDKKPSNSSSSLKRKRSSMGGKNVKKPVAKKKASVAKPPEPKLIIDYKAHDATLTAQITAILDAEWQNKHTVSLQRSKSEDVRSAIVIAGKEACGAKLVQKQEVSYLLEGLAANTLLTESLPLAGQDYFLTTTTTDAIHGRGDNLAKDSRVCILINKHWIVLWIYESPSLFHYQLSKTHHKVLKMASEYVLTPTKVMVPTSASKPVTPVP